MGTLMLLGRFLLAQDPPAGPVRCTEIEAINGAQNAHVGSTHVRLGMNILLVVKLENEQNAHGCSITLFMIKG